MSRLLFAVTVNHEQHFSYGGPIATTGGC